MYSSSQTGAHTRGRHPAAQHVNPTARSLLSAPSLYGPTEYFVNAPPAWANEFGPSAA
jgi:hypothetical protein